MPLWLFTARDKPGRLETRKATRPTHRDYITRKDLPAEMVFGSPLLDENGDMNGTWLVSVWREESFESLGPSGRGGHPVSTHLKKLSFRKY